ncbi:HET-domain-containing protein [Venturia nashicola]|uniref:HET-domain-containing protein n=1 Tax=Venturia nashicola TaxID=86259 RepID=A0A4Z1P121_9PEZI|nr:HET-domain-containing protein [Venturia nashicola]TLD34548.1 HET-domain-containing protein [Venturia nashicola]
MSSWLASFLGSWASDSNPSAALTAPAESPSNPVPIFKHERRLRKEDAEIRLLRISPATFHSSPLRCQLIYTSLDGLPTYKALSYTWGSPYSENLSRRPVPSLGEARLWIDNQPVNITANLNSALRYLRPQNEELILWVDAICINQNDNEEKAWQVQQMRRVYEIAISTIVWLGPPADGSDLAIEALCAMRRFALRTQHHRRLPGSGMVDMTQVENDDESPQAYADLVIAGSFGQLFQKPVQSSFELPLYPIEEVAALLERGWWARVWVLQELVLAKRVDFVCGTKVMPEADEVFGTFVNTWDHQVREFGRPARMLDHRPWTMIDTRLQYARSRELLPLRVLLEEAALASLQAKDPLDKIYGILSLAKDSAELGIEVNYTITHQELYTELAKAYILRGDLWFFSYCGTGIEPSTTLPSWVADWSHDHGFRPFGYMLASKQLPSQTPFATFPPLEPDRPLSQQRVVLQGIIIDTIDYVSEARPNHSQVNLSTLGRSQIVGWIARTTRELIDDLVDTPSRGTLDNACWTFVAGNIATPSTDYALPMSEQEAAIRGAFRKLLDMSTITTKLNFDDDWGTADSSTSPAMVRQRVESYFHCTMNVTNGRCAFRSRSGCMGLGSMRIHRGDKLVMFRGGVALMALRSVGIEGHYRIIGEVFANDSRKDSLYNQMLKDYGSALCGYTVDGDKKLEAIELE